MLYRPLQIREVGPLGLFRHLIGGRRSRSRRRPVIGGGERLSGRHEAGAARGPAGALRVVGRGRGGKMAGAGGRSSGGSLTLGRHLCGERPALPPGVCSAASRL